MAETRGELFDTREECAAFYSREENFARLSEGEIGDNLMYKYRAKASFFAWPEVCAGAMEATRAMLERRGLTAEIEGFDRFWADLHRFVEAQHASGASSAEITAPVEACLRYDIKSWIAAGHPVDIARFQLAEETPFLFSLTQEGAQELEAALDVWTSKLTGLTKLVTRIRIDSQVRHCRAADASSATPARLVNGPTLEAPNPLTPRKRALARLLRALGLISVADHLRYVATVIRYRAVNRRFARENPEFPLPPARLIYDATSTVHWPSYHELGRLDAEFMAGLILTHCTARPARVLDWGCGPARMIRHMPALLEPLSPELVGTDYNRETIAWCERALPEIEFQPNDLAPPLPFEDDSIDVLYCWSVFTHLSEEMHHRWLAEIIRVLKPGGLLVAMMCGDGHRFRLRPEELAPYDAGQLVVRSRAKEGKRTFAVFHSPGFVRKFLGDAFEILDRIPGARGTPRVHTAWVARLR